MPILSKAFTGCQQGHDESTETTGFYQLRRGGRPESTVPQSSFLEPESSLPGHLTGHYLESIAKTPLSLCRDTEKNAAEKPLDKPNFEREEGHGQDELRRPLKCGSWVAFGECEGGHGFAKAIDCGREWCLECRERSHRRRMARWVSKFQKIDFMGYLVITFPIDKRPRSKKELSRISVLITEALKRRGIKRGLRRWHWFGENSRLWNPHLNIVIDQGWLSSEKLDSIKKMVQGLIGADKIDVFYEYSQKIGKKLHWLKYITRPTFLDKEWDEAMAEELFNFRNSAWWGKWDDQDKWELPKREKSLGYIAKLEKNICPQCGLPVHWHGVKPIDEVFKLGYDQIWDRVWQLRAPPDKVILFKFLKTAIRSELENNGDGSSRGKGTESPELK